MTSRITRRALLRAGGTTTLAALLAACTSDDTDGAAGDDGTAAADPSAAGSTGALTVILPNYEVLTGVGQAITMGILGPDNRPLLDVEPQVAITLEGEVVADGITPTFYGEGLGDRGIYSMQPEIPSPGIHDVRVTVPGVGEGTAAFQARSPDDAQAPGAPGRQFPTLETPTTGAPGPFETLCTQDPPCSMHETSLDEAMAQGPVVFTLATPAFCQTAVCGPVVSVVEQVRDDVARDDVTFVHLEVFTDAGESYAPQVDELQLPSEPWTWVLDADGAVTTRFDGPVVPDLLAEAVRSL